MSLFSRMFRYVLASSHEEPERFTFAITDFASLNDTGRRSGSRD